MITRRAAHVDWLAASSLTSYDHGLVCLCIMSHLYDYATCSLYDRQSDRINKSTYAPLHIRYEWSPREVKRACSGLCESDRMMRIGGCWMEHLYDIGFSLL